MTAQPILIRRATPADLADLNRFQDGVVEAERAYDPTLQEGPVEYYDVAGMLTSDQVLFLVAEEHGRLVGCGFARLEPTKPYLRHDRRGYLGMMFVEPVHRGRGINGRIVDALKEWCRSRHVSELRLEVYRDNRAALGAYEKAGFRELFVEMRMNLNDP
jgi:ribosomal protein S18 acetylase RimI-like enzyme